MIYAITRVRLTHGLADGQPALRIRNVRMRVCRPDAEARKTPPMRMGRVPWFGHRREKWMRR